MQQSDRNLLYNIAYHLDNRKRIQGANGQMYVVFTHEELEKTAGDLRIVAEKDGELLVRRVEKR